MKRISKFCIAFAFSALSFTARAQNFDVTVELVNYLNDYFVGSQTSSSSEWDNTFCALSDPITGKCHQRGGTKIFGNASGKVDYLESRVGRGWMLQVVKDPWTNIDVISHWVDLKMFYYYSGESQGTKQCYPGDFFCGYEWESLHPTGRIAASFKAAADHVEVKMTYDVVGGHGDKPNKILRDAMVALKPKMQQVVTDFIRLKGSAASVTIID